MNTAQRVLIGINIAMILGISLACSKGTAQWQRAWRPTTPMTTPRAGFSAVTHGDRLYVMGGVDGKNFLASTETSPLLPNGELGPWEIGPNLNFSRGFFAAVTNRDQLYAVGGAYGKNGAVLLDSVERSTIGEDGRLSVFVVEQHRLNLPRRCVKLMVKDNFLYAIGGYAGQALNSVERAEIRHDGSLGPWTLMEQSLVHPRYVSGLATHKDHTFLLGGHGTLQGKGQESVEFLTGEKWQATTSLQHGRYGLAGLVMGGRLYAIGGLSGVKYYNNIEVSSIGEDGSLTSWRSTTDLPQGLAEFSAISHGNHLYILGGTNQFGYHRGVNYAQVNQHGDIGYWGKAIPASQPKATPTSLTALPFRGTIAEVVRSQGYVYLRIEFADNEWWIATQGEEFRTGQTIEHSKGVKMRDFYSKSLQKQFAEIIFTSRYRIIQ